MSSPHEQERFTDDLKEVADTLQDRRPTLDPLALDRVKLRAMSAASRSASTTRDRGFFMRSRLTTLLAAAFLALGTGGALALAGGGSGGKGGGSASFSQYRCEHSGHGSHCEEKREENEEKREEKEEKGKGKKHH